MNLELKITHNVNWKLTTQADLVYIIYLFIYLLAYLLVCKIVLLMLELQNVQLLIII